MESKLNVGVGRRQNTDGKTLPSDPREPVKVDRTSAPRTRKRLERRYWKLSIYTDWTMSRLGLAQPVVLISGFWRSGTTWLQESLADSLNAKTVFEPLSPEVPRRDIVLRRAGIESYDARQALIPGQAGPEDGVWEYLDRAMRGEYGTWFTLLCRESPGEALRRLIVAKDVRLQFNLRDAHDRYGIPIVHIRRHPAAAISSLLRTKWGWTFDDVRLADMLPSHAEELAEFDTDLISRLSACWAVTERFVDMTIGGFPWSRIVCYEAAVSKSSPTISDLCAFIGHKQRREPDFRTRSASTQGGREALSDTDRQRVRSIVARLYPEFVFDGGIQHAV